MNNYVKFGVMMLTSFVLMYGIMFLNVASVDHVYFSLMRNYMTLLMVSVMAFTMLLFMWSMYKNIKINVAILVGSVLIFGLTLFGVRTKNTH